MGVDVRVSGGGKAGLAFEERYAGGARELGSAAETADVGQVGVGFRIIRKPAHLRQVADVLAARGASKDAALLRRAARAGARLVLDW